VAEKMPNSKSPKGTKSSRFKSEEQHTRNENSRDQQATQALLEQLNQLFMQHGLRKVTMDFAAAELGVSKKTLYKYFSNRPDMVSKTLHWHIEQESCQLVEIKAEAENAIDEMLKVATHVNEQLALLNPNAVLEARQYYPEAWEFMENYHREHLRETIESNLKAGIREGLYRQDLNPEIIARLYVGRMDVFFDPEYFPANQFRITEVYREFMNYHIRGIASREGVAYLESRLNQHINEHSKRA
jgi:AcrR family transcriptional regulator